MQYKPHKSLNFNAQREKNRYLTKKIYIFLLFHLHNKLKGVHLQSEQFES